MTRNQAIDITKGIGILLVIVGHTGGKPEFIGHWIYSFHMPLFFLLGGYLSKPTTTAYRIKKDFSRLISPYLFSVCLLVGWFILLGIKYDNYDMVWRTIQAGAFGSGQYHSSPIWGNFPTIGMIWFLLAMFWCRVAYNMIARLSILYKYLVAATVAMLATMADNFIINLPCGILTGLSAVLFYTLGNMLHDNIELIQAKKPYLIMFGVCCWVLALWQSGLSMAACHYEYYLLDIAGACGATWLVYWISGILDKQTKYTATVLTWFGANSLTILCAHFLEESSFLWEHLHVPTEWYVILPLRICFIISFTLIAGKIAFTKKLYGVISFSAIRKTLHKQQLQ